VLGATTNTMLQSAATLALADANIGNDTGISNLAAALDRPSYVLLGNRPLLSHDPLMRMLLTPSRRFPPAKGPPTPVHLDRISVADVLARLETDQAPGFEAARRPSGLRTALDLRGRPWTNVWPAAGGPSSAICAPASSSAWSRPRASPDLAGCFPATFTRLSAADLHGEAWSVWHPEPVWLKVRNVFAQHPWPAPSSHSGASPGRGAAAAGHAGPAPRVLVDLADGPQRQTLLQALQDEGLQGGTSTPASRATRAPAG
jgi:hypothetical protein